MPNTIEVRRIIEKYADNGRAGYIVETLDGRRIKTHKTPVVAEAT